MSYSTATRLGLSLGLLPLFATAALAQAFNSGSDGSDGAWVVAGGQGPIAFVASKSTYHFTTITIGAGTIVQIRGSATPVTVAPLTLLAQGDVTIAGTLDLDGDPGVASGTKPTPALPGLGGWPGGQGAETSTDMAQAGGGAGGGRPGSSSASGFPAAHLSQRSGNARTYGNRFLLPLLGGSGGGGGPFSSLNGGASGGGGGGALLIASSGAIRVLDSGRISAQGGAAGLSSSPSNGAGGGSGGAVRLAANVIDGQGSLRVEGGPATPGTTRQAGSPGRVRLEAPVCHFPDVLPIASLSRAVRPGPLTVPASAPTLKIVKIEYTDAITGQPASIDPVATNNGSSSTVDAAINATGVVKFHFEGTGIPLTGPRQVRIHLKPDSGGDGGPLTAPGTQLNLAADPARPGVSIGSVDVQLWGVTPLAFPNGFSRVFFTVSW